MYTDRDYKVLDFLTEFHAARTAVLQQLFFPSYRIATRRLSQLAELKAIRRERDMQTTEYIYYIKRPKQLKHDIVRADVYALFCRTTTVNSFAMEPTIADIRPDALIAYTDNGKPQLAFVEVEVSNKGLDVAKYERLRDSGAYKQYFPIMPKLVVVTDKKVPQTSLDVMVIPMRI